MIEKGHALLHVSRWGYMIGRGDLHLLEGHGWEFTMDTGAAAWAMWIGALHREGSCSLSDPGWDTEWTEKIYCSIGDLVDCIARIEEICHDLWYLGHGAGWIEEPLAIWENRLPWEMLDALSLDTSKVRLEELWWSCGDPCSLQGSWARCPLGILFNSEDSVK